MVASPANRPARWRIRHMRPTIGRRSPKQGAVGRSQGAVHRCRADRSNRNGLAGHMTDTSLDRRAVLAAGLALPALASAFAAGAAEPFRFKSSAGVETDAERGDFEVPED